jgi:L-ascorbate metabolism protein UlaG (beta-lactamase superfamily)
MSNEISLSFHGKTFIEIAAPGTTLFFDPVFATERRGRRVRGDTRSADYVLLTQESDDFEDVLDVLEDGDATLIANERLCRAAGRELSLERSRLLDLAEWERASHDDLRVTAVPVFAASMMDDSLSLLDELSGMAPLPRALSSLPFGRSARALAGVPSMIRGEVSRAIRGKASLGYLIQIGDTRILHLGAGIHAGTDERDLEDIADLGAIDVLSVEVGPRGVEPFVRAARIFEPRTMALYRSYDAYGRGRRAQSLPLSAFADAIREDRGDATDPVALRPGDRILFEAPTAPNAKSSRAPSASAPAAGAQAEKPS